MKFNKPWSSFTYNPNLSNREQWLAPFRDPAYLIISGITLVVTIYCINECYFKLF